jgi:hypothetical protein
MLVQEMLSSNCVAEDSGMFVVSHPDGEVTLVNKETLRCTCIASSHEASCLCISLVSANYLLPSSKSANVNPVEQPSSSAADKIDLAREKLQKIVDFMSGSDIENHRNCNKILNDINSLHTSIFGQFRKQTLKRKISKLHPNRPGHSAPKKVCDHSYSQVKGKPTANLVIKNEDGSFKKHRSKGKVRRSFNN